MQSMELTFETKHSETVTMIFSAHARFDRNGVPIGLMAVGQVEYKYSTVQYALYTIHCTLCTVGQVQYSTVCTMHCRTGTVEYALCTVQVCTVGQVQYSMHYTLYTMH
jgi:hypothetical protein